MKFLSRETTYTVHVN